MKQKEAFQPQKTAEQVKVENNMRLLKIQDARDTVNEYLVNSANRYLDLLEEKGEENPLVQFRRLMLDVFIGLRDITLVVCDTAELLVEMNQMLTQMDQALEVIVDFFEESKQYTAQDIRNLKKHIKRFNKSFKNRVKLVSVTMKGFAHIIPNSQKQLNALKKLKITPPLFSKGAVTSQGAVENLLASVKQQRTVSGATNVSASQQQSFASIDDAGNAGGFPI